MIIKGLVGDKLASMSFNEHHYVLKKVAMSFSTLYYLGLDPIFANYIKENDTLVVSGKISERDLLEEEATIYSGIIITKDKESISANDINNNTKYLKNIDVKTGECFSRYYFDGDIKDIKLDLYSYKENNSFVLVTPNLEKNDFNIFNIKEKLNKTAMFLSLKKLCDKFNVVQVVECLQNDVITEKHLEVIINYNNNDIIRVPFDLNDSKKIEFYPFIYSEYFNSWYKLKKDNTMISFESFPYYFLKNELITILNSLVNNNDKIFTKIYLNKEVNNLFANRK